MAGCTPQSLRLEVLVGTSQDSWSCEGDASILIESGVAVEALWPSTSALSMKPSPRCFADNASQEAPSYR
jgi:hypothetical protein